MPHPPLAAAPRIRPLAAAPPPHPSLALSLAPPSHLWPIFGTYRCFSFTCRRFFVTYRRLSGSYVHGILPTLSLVDALFTYGHAIAHRQVSIASIRPGRRVCDSTRAGDAALLWWCMVLFREVAWNRAQIRAHIRARMWTQAPAASMAATKNRLATLTVVRRHLTSSSGSREEQWVMLAAAAVKRKL